MTGRFGNILCSTRQLLAAMLIILLFGYQLSGLDPAKPVDQYLVDHSLVVTRHPFPGTSAYIPLNKNNGQRRVTRK